MQDFHNTGKCGIYAAKKNQLIQSLKEGITGGLYRPGERLPSERRLAEMLHLARPVVHQCILDLESERLLVRNGRKLFLTQKAFDNLQSGVAVPERKVVVLALNSYYRNPTYLEFFQTLNKYLPEKTQCEMRFCSGEADFTAQPFSEDTVAVMLGEWMPNAVSRHFGHNIIYVNNRFREGNYIVPDNYAGGRILAEHLWKLGHRHVAVVFLSQGDEGFGEFVDRHRGIVDSFAEHHEIVATLSVGRQYTLDEACKEMFTTLLRHRDFTALVVLRDVVAIEFLSLARREGLSIPEDFSLARFDDSYYSSFVSPSLTSMRFPVQEIAVLTAEAIQEAFARPAHECFCQKTIPLQLMERCSTAPVKAK